MLRTTAEIQATMTTELPGIEPGLAGYWRFNDGGAVAPDDSLGIATATLLNGTPWVPDGPLTPDIDGADISGIATSKFTASGATIPFTTDEPTTGWMAYSKPAPCLVTEVFSAAIGTIACDHAHRADGGDDSQYHDAERTMPPPTPSRRRPELPDAGRPARLRGAGRGARDAPSRHGGGVGALEATANDNIGVVDVVLQTRWRGHLGTAGQHGPGFGGDGILTPVTDGAHVLTAEARDAAGNSAPRRSRRWCRRSGARAALRGLRRRE